MRIWCVGQAETVLPALDGVTFEWELPAKVDAVLALRGATDALYDELNRINRLVTPILDFSRHGLPRADYAAAPLSADELRRALAAVEPIQRTVNALPKVISGDRNGLAALALAYTRDTEIRARWSAEVRSFVDYPLLSGLPGRRDLVEELAHSGLLRRRYFDRLHLCSACGSARLNVCEECHACRSSQIVEFSLIHHYRCAYQAAEEEFVQDERLICPKCRREVRHYGVDYERPGTSFFCRDCDAISPEPEVGFRCIDCDRHTPGEHADTLAWYHYVLMPEAVAALERGMLPTTSLETAMAGYKGACSHRDFIKLASFHSVLCAQPRTKRRRVIAGDAPSGAALAAPGARRAHPGRERALEGDRTAASAARGRHPARLGDRAPTARSDAGGIRCHRRAYQAFGRVAVRRARGESRRAHLAAPQRGSGSPGASLRRGEVPAPVTGRVGKLDVSRGTVVRPGESLIDIVHGDPYVLGYIESGALFQIEQGQRVLVRNGLARFLGEVARILPISAKLPAEFQQTFRPPQRSQVLRIRSLRDEAPPTYSRVEIVAASGWWRSLAAWTAW